MSNVENTIETHPVLRPVSEFVLNSNGVDSRVRELRTSALAALKELGLPTAKNESWKYTSIRELEAQEFKLPAEERHSVELQKLGENLISGTTRFVFVDGWFDGTKSSAPPQGVSFASIAELSSGKGTREDLEAFFAHVAGGASEKENSFAAVNSAAFRDGAFIRIKGRVEQPIELVFIASERAGSCLLPVRNLIFCEPDSSAAVIETFIGLAAEKYLTSTLTELHAGERSSVEHIKLGFETEQAFHVGLLRTEQRRHSKLTTAAFTFGGRLVRNEFAPRLAGEGIEAHLNGLTVIGGLQHVDNNLTIDHAEPNCFSRESFKGIYSGKAAGVFTGTIIVRPGAQKTNAIQSSKSLLLSPDASVNARPQLKIWADDVKCTHGATVGQLDEDALFYLRSRGIGALEARNILVHAFASDIVEQVSIPALRKLLQERLLEALPK